MRHSKPSPYSLVLIFLWAIIIFNSQAMGKIEGSLFPVVSNFEYSITEETLSYTEIEGSFSKLRNCAFEHLDWYINDAEGFSGAVDIEFGNFALRKEGMQEFSGWKVHNDGYPLRYSSVFVTHECHPFWDTVTVMK